MGAARPGRWVRPHGSGQRISEGFGQCWWSPISGLRWRHGASARAGGRRAGGCRCPQGGGRVPPIGVATPDACLNNGGCGAFSRASNGPVIVGGGGIIAAARGRRAVSYCTGSDCVVRDSGNVGAEGWARGRSPFGDVPAPDFAVPMGGVGDAGNSDTGRDFPPVPHRARGQSRQCRAPLGERGNRIGVLAVSAGGMAVAPLGVSDSGIGALGAKDSPQVSAGERGRFPPVSVEAPGDGVRQEEGSGCMSGSRGGANYSDTVSVGGRPRSRLWGTITRGNGAVRG